MEIQYLSETSDPECIFLDVNTKSQIQILHKSEPKKGSNSISCFCKSSLNCWELFYILFLKDITPFKQYCTMQTFLFMSDFQTINQGFKFQFKGYEAVLYRMYSSSAILPSPFPSKVSIICVASCKEIFCI